MIKEKLKQTLEKFKTNDQKRKMENLVLLLIILIVTIIVINTIWKDEKEEKRDEKVQEHTSIYEKLAENTEKEEDKSSDLETKLEQILSKMEGVGSVKVMITYSQTSEIVPLQNETTKTSLTEEEDSGGGKRKIEQKDTSTEIIYSASNNPETKTIINPIVKGAIIIAEGASDVTTKSNIISAVEAITGLATYKIQVFEMKE